MAGVMRVGKTVPPIVAIPTTSGTGSETTIAAVITDSETHHKYALMDLKLMPLYAILDPELAVGLPPRHDRDHRHGRAYARDRGVHQLDV